MGRRRVAVAVAAALALTAGVESARANGDPASDVLYFQDVFVSYTKPSPEVAAKLEAEVAKANASGYRIKVAVVFNPQDLGSIPSLFNRAPLYARFLGAELRTFYVNRLLIVMPAGFGFFNNGLPTTKEEAILAEITIDGSSSDGLTEAAAAAVEKLRTSEQVTRSKDATAPKVTAFTAKAKRGKPVKLTYRVSDNSGKSVEFVRVYGPNFLLYATLTSPMGPARAGTRDSVTWKVPKKIPARALRFCVLAADPSGNQSRPSCAPVRIA